MVEIREGDALETLARDLPDTIDFVLLDGAKMLYLQILTLLDDRLRSGALVVADNADAESRIRCPRPVRRQRLFVSPLRRRRRTVDAVGACGAGQLRSRSESVFPNGRTALSGVIRKVLPTKPVIKISEEPGCSGPDR